MPNLPQTFFATLQARNNLTWLKLNGPWEFQGADAAAAIPFNTSLQQCINVAFPQESALSGIGQHYNYSFYRRTFTLPASWGTKGQNRFLLQARVTLLAQTVPSSFC